MNYPGKNNESFVIKLDASYFDKGEIFENPDGEKYIITKVYKFNWYRKLLLYFGMPFKMFNCVKVKDYE